MSKDEDILQGTYHLLIHERLKKAEYEKRHPRTVIKELLAEGTSPHILGEHLMWWRDHCAGQGNDGPHLLKILRLINELSLRPEFLAAVVRRESKLAMEKKKKEEGR